MYLAPTFYASFVTVNNEWLCLLCWWCQQVGTSSQVHLEVLQYLPPSAMIWSHGDNPVRSICHFPGRGVGKPQEAQIWHGLSSPSAKSGGRGGRRFGLGAVWVHTCQAHLSLLEEVVRKLTLLINTKEDWPYAFVQLCKDSQHVPLSSARHISAMIDGAPSKSTWDDLVN